MEHISDRLLEKAKRDYPPGTKVGCLRGWHLMGSETGILTGPYSIQENGIWAWGSTYLLCLYSKGKWTKKITDSWIAKPNPDTIEECMTIFQSIRYKSVGFPIVSLDYDYTVTKKWRVSFRNPVNFSNPDNGAATPLEACHNMLDFLRKHKEDAKKPV